jgi:hypothetical protein
MSSVTTRHRPIHALILLLAAHAGTGASDRAISVCEALSEREMLRDKLVAIRGVQVATGEGAWLEGTSCDPLITNGFEWPTLIWLEMSREWRIEAGIETKELAASTKRIDSDLAKRHFDPERDRLTLTYIGVLKTFDDLGKQVYRDSTKARGIGYGHMNGAPVELIVKDVKDAAIERKEKHKEPAKN